MQIIITGGAGFLGQRLAKALLESTLVFDALLLVDIVMPPNPGGDERITCLQADLAGEGIVRSIVNSKTGIVYHLAAVVSSHAEKDFDLGWKVNVDVTRQLLEACRQQRSGIRFVFASSLAVYGGKLPSVIEDTTVVTPRSSYGAQKATAELLINDYTRKNFVDGRVLRLPTVCVRPGRPNQAASSFVSSIIREPLNGEQAVCPVSPKLAICLASPDTIIRNLIKGSVLDAAVFGDWRAVNLPGISVTVQQMLESLERATDKSTVALVKFEPDSRINDIVSGWPGAIANSSAVQLGFSADVDFDEVIRQYITEKGVASYC